MAYPHSPKETLADGAVHAAGLMMAIPGCGLLLWSAADASTTLQTATTIYAACLIAAFIASAIYHMCPIDRLRPVLGRIDHAAIYFKIAASYTPFVVLIGTGFAYSVLAAVWILALAGAVAKMTIWRVHARGSLALYLGMGWLSALLIWPIYQHLSLSVVVLVIVGGLIYSAGTRIYAHPGMRFQNAIWHAYVLTASTCLFLAVALSL